MNRSSHLSLVRDADEGPTDTELAAIEAESPVIEAQLDVLDAEIAVLDRLPSPLDERRLRHAHHRLLVARVAVANRAAQRLEAGA